jgi:undecaprenyl-diphosphatase
VTLPQAVALGLLHGPAELAPVSSSAHATLLAWRRGWRYGELDAASRKRFEVALHAGSAAASLWRARRALTGTPAATVVAACVPPALAGALLQRPIEERLGTPAGIAAGLLAGSAAMALADVLGPRTRLRTQAGLRDGLALGLAQAAALAPGVSRSGAARAAARWRGFAPAEARSLADAVGVPVTLGALALKGREARHAERSQWPALAVGAGASLCSALASAPLAARVERSGSLLPYCTYRIVLATAVIRRLRQNAWT